MALIHILTDLNRSIMDVKEMRANDPQSDIKFEELSLKARPLQGYLNEHRGAHFFLKAAVTAMVAAKRQKDLARHYAEALYPVASRNLSFNHPPAQLRAVSSIPPEPSLAAN